MAHALGTCMAASTLPSLHLSSSPLASSGARALSLRASFSPGLVASSKRGLSQKGLRLRRGIRCDAAVAEKDAEETSGEKFEYQAEVWFCFCF